MRRPTLLFATLFALVVGSCGARDDGLHVFAAACLTDAVEQLAAAHTAAGGGAVGVSVGASSTLARQIVDGAPADVFVSANRAWIDVLAAGDLLSGEPVALASNQLVCVVPAGEPPAWSDLAGLAAAGIAVAVADAAVPAGDYARQALQASDLFDDLGPLLVGQRDVRAVLAAVASGNLPAGFVYASDAAARPDDVRVVFHVDPALHEPITCWAAVLRGARDPAAARAFLERALGPDGVDVLERHGFHPPQC